MQKVDYVIKGFRWEVWIRHRGFRPEDFASRLIRFGEFRNAFARFPSANLETGFQPIPDVPPDEKAKRGWDDPEPF